MSKYKPGDILLFTAKQDYMDARLGDSVILKILETNPPQSRIYCKTLASFGNLQRISEFSRSCDIYNQAKIININEDLLKALCGDNDD